MSERSFFRHLQPLRWAELETNFTEYRITCRCANSHKLHATETVVVSSASKPVARVAQSQLMSLKVAFHIAVPNFETLLIIMAMAVTEPGSQPLSDRHYLANPRPHVLSLALASHLDRVYKQLEALRFRLRLYAACRLHAIQNSLLGG